MTARFHVPLVLPRIACTFFTVISHASTILSIAHPLTDLFLCSALEFWFPPLHFPRIIFPYLHSCSTPRIPSLSPEGPLPAVWLPVICSAGLLPTPNSSSPYVTLPSFPRFFGPSFLSRSASFTSFLSFLMFARKHSYLSCGDDTSSYGSYPSMIATDCDQYHLMRVAWFARWQRIKEKSQMLIIMWKNPLYYCVVDESRPKQNPNKTKTRLKQD